MIITEKTRKIIMKADTIVIRITIIEGDGMTTMIPIKLTTRTMIEIGGGMTGGTTSQSNKIISLLEIRCTFFFFATDSDT